MMRRYDVKEAVTDSRYATAQNNARREKERIDREREEALSHLTGDDTDNIKNVDKHSVDRSADGFPKTTLWSRVFQNRV